MFYYRVSILYQYLSSHTRDLTEIEESKSSSVVRAFAFHQCDPGSIPDLFTVAHKGQRLYLKCSVFL